jgi:hypothetical protein
MTGWAKKVLRSFWICDKNRGTFLGVRRSNLTLFPLAYILHVLYSEKETTKERLNERIFGTYRSGVDVFAFHERGGMGLENQ